MSATSVIVADLNPHRQAQAAAMGATGFVLSGPKLQDELTLRLGGAPDGVSKCVGTCGLLDTVVALVCAQVLVVRLGRCVVGDAWDAFRALSKEVTIGMSAFFTVHECSTAIDALAGAPFHLQARLSLDAVPRTFAALHHRTTQCKVLIEMGQPASTKHKGPRWHIPFRRFPTTSTASRP